jgi:hypothetical protein
MKLYVVLIILILSLISCGNPEIQLPSDYEYDLWKQTYKTRLSTAKFIEKHVDCDYHKWNDCCIVEFSNWIQKNDKLILVDRKIVKWQCSYFWECNCWHSGPWIKNNDPYCCFIKTII